MCIYIKGFVRKGVYVRGFGCVEVSACKSLFVQELLCVESSVW